MREAGNQPTNGEHQVRRREREHGVANDAQRHQKEQNLKRLDELALILGREPDISGSAAEIAQRVAEWEEEMQSSGDDVQVMNMDIRERETAAHDVREETSGALTRIRVLTCLHLCGVDGETGESVKLADVGRVILIMSSDAKTHVDGGMAVYA
ncbi:DNA-packaging protein FI [Pseudomonas aeruginosa]